MILDGSPGEILEKYNEWLFNSIEVINGRDPGEYRRKALELPGHYKWGCFCKPNSCHVDILLQWLKEQLVFVDRIGKSIKVVDVTTTNLAGDGVVNMSKNDSQTSTS